MPSFNTADFIERSIKSVVEQDYPNFELFIKDGGSVDDSVKIIKKYQQKYPKILSWISQKDAGQTQAINLGIKKTDGEIVAYLNSDDVYKKGAFKLIGDYFMNNPDSKWVFGKCDIIDDKDKEIRSWITSYKNFWISFSSYNTLLVLNYISQMGVFFRREVIDQVGYFDESQHYVMDYDYWLKLYKLFPPGKINQTLASFRISSKSKSTTGFLKQFDDEIKVAKKHSSNDLLISLHFLHANMVKTAYTSLSFLNLNNNE